MGKKQKDLEALMDYHSNLFKKHEISFLKQKDKVEFLLKENMLETFFEEVERLKKLWLKVESLRLRKEYAIDRYNRELNI